jgi:hypothetical protein
MNGEATDLDLGQVDEEILTSTISDEALEAAAGGGRQSYNTVSYLYYTDCC